MPEVEHGFLPVRSLLTLLLISAIIAVGKVPAGEVPFPRIDSLLSEGKVVEARAELLRLAEENAGTDEEWLALFYLNELEREGEKYFDRLSELADLWGAPETWLALGKYRYAVGAYRSAADDFGRASRGWKGERANDAECWWGISLVAAGETEEGLRTLQATAKRERDGAASLRARFLAAEVYADLGEPERCDEMLRPLFDGDHQWLRPALLLHARAAEALGDEAEAAKTFRDLVERFPESAEAGEAARALAIASEPSGAAGEGVSFFVQIGSFEKIENADSFVEARRSEGIGAIHIHLDESEERSLYQVRIGPFANSGDAEKARENLEEHEGLPGHVVKSGEED